MCVAGLWQPIPATATAATTAAATTAAAAPGPAAALPVRRAIPRRGRGGSRGVPSGGVVAAGPPGVRVPPAPAAGLLVLLHAPVCPRGRRAGEPKQ